MNIGLFALRSIRRAVFTAFLVVFTMALAGCGGSLIAHDGPDSDGPDSDGPDNMADHRNWISGYGRLQEAVLFGVFQAEREAENARAKSSKISDQISKSLKHEEPVDQAMITEWELAIEDEILFTARFHIMREYLHCLIVMTKKSPYEDIPNVFPADHLPQEKLLLAREKAYFELVSRSVEIGTMLEYLEGSLLLLQQEKSNLRVEIDEYHYYGPFDFNSKDASNLTAEWGRVLLVEEALILQIDAARELSSCEGEILS